MSLEELLRAENDLLHEFITSIRKIVNGEDEETIVPLLRELFDVTEKT